MESVKDLLMDVGDSLNEGEVEEIVFLLKDYLQGKLVVINTKKAGGKKKNILAISLAKKLENSICL